MSRSALTALAATTLLVTIWLAIAAATRPSEQLWAALGAGVAACVTMQLAVAAARKEDRVRR